jgi:hypothetical protein
VPVRARESHGVTESGHVRMCHEFSDAEALGATMPQRTWLERARRVFGVCVGARVTERSQGRRVSQDSGRSPGNPWSMWPEGGMMMFAARPTIKGAPTSPMGSCASLGVAAVARFPSKPSPTLPCGKSTLWSRLCSGFS